MGYKERINVLRSITYDRHFGRDVRLGKIWIAESKCD